MQPIYLLVGVPCSGKSWVCSQLKEQFHFIPHDDFIRPNEKNNVAYVTAILDQTPKAEKPVLIEAPFSVSEIKDPLESLGHIVNQVFIHESEETLKDRYRNRESKDIPKGHITRNRTYLDRAITGKHFYGTSSEVLDHLQGL